MKKKYIVLIINIMFNVLTPYAQVTIGSLEKPEKAAILQLKSIPDITDGSVNSDKGIVMPRVELTDVNNLYPMFEKSAGNGANDKYNTPELKDAEDLNHVGLIVYNTTLSDKFCPGLHTWIGDRWESLIAYKCFRIAIKQDKVAYDVNDATTTTEYIDVSWAPKGSTVTLSQVATKNGGLRNISFPASITDPSGTKKVGITVASMTNAEIKTNPIVDRESKITAKITLGSTTKEASVLLKQYHSGLVAYPSSSYMMDGKRKQLLVKSSGDWTVKIKDNPNNALKLVTTSGKASPTTGEYLQFDLVDDMTDPQIFLSKVVLTFSSINGTFDDVDVPLRCGSYYYVPETKILVAWTDANSSKSQLSAQVLCSSMGLSLPTEQQLLSMVRYFKNGEGVSSGLTGFGYLNSGYSSYWSSNTKLIKQGKETVKAYNIVDMLSGASTYVQSGEAGVRCVKPHPNPPTP